MSSPAAYAHRTAYIRVSVVFFLMVTAAVVHRGYRGRVYDPGQTTLTLSSPAEAYDAWKDRDLRGRVLVLFDQHPRMWGLRSYGGEPKLSDENVFEYAILNNVVRRIYLVVPDRSWEDFLRARGLKVLRKADPLERGLHVYTINGASLVATTPSSLPGLSEKVLVYINGSMFAPQQALDTLRQKGISSDMVVIWPGPR